MHTRIVPGAFMTCIVAVRLVRKKRRELPLSFRPPADLNIGHLRLLLNVQNMAEVF